MVEVVYPICRIINQSKYVFTSCKIVKDDKLIVGTNTGLLLIYDLNLQDSLILLYNYYFLGRGSSCVPIEIDIGKFQDYMIVNDDYIVYLSIKGVI
jgi:hypothetical protein